jgi:hypothetical protein
MKSLKHLFWLALSVALILSPAKAALLQYDVTYNDGSSGFNFKIDTSQATLDPFWLPDTAFYFTNVASSKGVLPFLEFFSGPTSPDDVNQGLGGAFSAGSSKGLADIYNFFGLQLFSYDPSTPNVGPTFLTTDPLAPFAIYGLSSVEPIASLVVTAVPEASTWVMMILGFSGIGYFARWRHHGRAPAVA